ncbi:Cof-type HAD-IIB family hydrolase [Bacillus sonorensis]|uniref:Cof-type HAD-IIB family hydrolase n=1 Tax=Bacillus sonorensis TaxID=119858 RepID=UPI002DBD0884|nr:Cof-type HAD-IIB family hydrolase [Bacillus sonorensis]MEC1352813.1 Cof-type HAD-IIB family hydrolase [Bacillus sonorensis]MEC1426323.1 Cof-type HAD-IIB family hydrolase [Bacillus sonorensis]
METKPYLIALDLDGTLLKDDKTISESSSEVIRKLKEDGHYVCISTGRPFRASAVYYDQLQLDTPIVNFNGAFVHHPKDESWGRFHTSLDLDAVKQIIEVSESYNVHNILAEIMDDVYFHYHDEKLIDVFTMGNPNITVGDLRKNLGEDVTSVLIHAKEEDVPAIRSYLSDVHAEMVDHRRWAAPWHVIELIKSGINKAVGLQKITDYYGIPRERVIAFGDEDNDLEMLEFAGCGVAMGNGITGVKNVADQIAKSNEEDGIAVFLKDYFSL